MSNWLEDIAKNIPTIVEKISEVVMGELNVEMQNRIFEQSNDVLGMGIKYGESYSEEWEERRLKAGKQVLYIDLQFTGKLRKSITRTKDTSGESIIWGNFVEARKADNIEVLYEQIIFAPSKTESEKVLTSFENIFYESIDQLAKRAKT